MITSSKCASSEHVRALLLKGAAAVSPTRQLVAASSLLYRRPAEAVQELGGTDLWMDGDELWS